METVTINDVARYAQVSRATVSRVLNNNAKVEQALRVRVLEAIEALNYQPNHVARRLRAQSSNVLGLIVSDIQNPYFISVIQGVEDAAYASHMSIILCNSNEDPLNTPRSPLFHSRPTNSVEKWFNFSCGVFRNPMRRIRPSACKRI